MILLQRLLLLIVFFVVGGHAWAAQKIVTLAPNLTEIVFALGGGEKLVGTSLQCNFPEAAKKTFKVGDYISPNEELILKSGANLVLSTEGNPKVTLERLKRKGLRVVETNPLNVAELAASVRTIAEEIGAKKEGDELAKKIDLAVADLSQAGKKKTRRPRVLLVLQFDPLYAVSDGTWIGDLFSIAGFENIAKGTAVRYPVLSREFVLKENPDAIFVFSSDKNDGTEGYVAGLYKGTKRKIPKIIRVPNDILVRPGPRILDGIAFLKSVML